MPGLGLPAMPWLGLVNPENDLRRLRGMKLDPRIEVTKVIFGQSGRGPT